jgi:UDP-2,3-diacylglucosamine pyrophosphatase LpxH
VHRPQIRKIQTKKGSVTYLNSGDWVENLSSLEYSNGKWDLFFYHNDLEFKNIDRG